MWRVNWLCREGGGRCGLHFRRSARSRIRSFRGCPWKLGDCGTACRFPESVCRTYGRLSGLFRRAGFLRHLRLCRHRPGWSDLFLLLLKLFQKFDSFQAGRGLSGGQDGVDAQFFGLLQGFKGIPAHIEGTVKGNGHSVGGIHEFFIYSI